MAVKAYEPRAGVEGLVIDGFSAAGEYFVVGDEDHPWPYATGNSREQNFLDAHPQVKAASVEEAESHDPQAEATVEATEHNATASAAELAVQEDVDLASVPGSGEGGRILLSDVQGVVAEREDSAGESEAGEDG